MKLSLGALWFGERKVRKAWKFGEFGDKSFRNRKCNYAHNVTVVLSCFYLKLTKQPLSAKNLST